MGQSTRSIRGALPVLAAPALALALALGPTAAAGEHQVDPARSLGPIGHEGVNPGGVAGVGYSEDFEAFTVGDIDGQDGWDGPAGRAVITDQDPVGDLLSARHSSDPGEAALFEMNLDPLPGGVSFGIIAADILITGENLYQFCPRDTTSPQQFFNTRVQFNPNGAVEVAQVNDQGNAFEFIDSGATWQVGVVHRIAVEVVDAAGELNVYLDGSLIFTGLETHADLFGETNGTSAYYTFSLNNAEGTCTLDNFSPDPGEPPVTGACCLPDDSCVEVSQASCEIGQKGIYQGDGVLCADVTCVPEPEGACCLPDESCVAATQADCEAQSGVYQGDEVLCMDVDCAPEPEGACCLADTSCQSLTEADCLAQEGTYQGDGVVCDPDPCDMGEPCPWDLDGNGEVEVPDLTMMIFAWGDCPAPPDPCPADLNDDGEVEVPDLVQLIFNWGLCP